MRAVAADASVHRSIAFGAAVTRGARELPVRFRERPRSGQGGRAATEHDQANDGQRENDRPDSVRPKARHVARRGGEDAVTAQELYERCRAELAGFKQPKGIAFLPLESFPRSASGKVQRHELEKRLAETTLEEPRR